MFWRVVIFSMAGPVSHDPLCLDGEVVDEDAAHDHGFKLGPGSSLMDLQLIPVVAGDVKCGCDYIVIFTWLDEKHKCQFNVVLLFGAVRYHVSWFRERRRSCVRS